MATFGLPLETARIRIGITEKNQSAYWDMVNAGLHDAALKVGAHVDVRSPLYEDVAAQVEHAEAFVAEGFDAIAFTATQEEPFLPVVEAARRAGVVITTIDLDAPNSGRLFYVGTRHFPELGALAGRLLLDATDRRGPVLIQTGSLSAPGAVGKLRGFDDAVRVAGMQTVGWLNDGEDLGRAYDNAVRLLQEHPDAVAMHGPYAYHSVVAAQAVADVRPGGEVTIVGHDVLPETLANIRTGSVAASIWVREYFFGYLTVTSLATCLVHGPEAVLRLMGLPLGDGPSCVRRVDPLVVTRANVEAVTAELEARSVTGRVASSRV